MRVLSVLAVVFASAALAACGDDNPTISSSDYLDKCQSQAGDQIKQGSANITDGQIADICKCTQDKLVAAGLGDKHINDQDLSETKGAEVGRECAVQVLTGG